MTKHSKYENERRSRRDGRVKEIEAAWLGSLPARSRKAFAADVEAAARLAPRSGPRPNMAPGTAPAPAASRPRAAPLQGGAHSAAPATDGGSRSDGSRATRQQRSPNVPALDVTRAPSLVPTPSW